MTDIRMLLVVAFAVTMPDLGVCQSAQGGRDARTPMSGDIIVATVTRVSKHQPTYGNPPRVELKIHEVLRGDPNTRRNAAIWGPPSHDIDYGGGNSEKRLREWGSQPMSAPEVGSKWILWGFVRTPPGEFVAWDKPRFRYSDETRRQALAMIRDAEQWERNRRAEIAANWKARIEARAKWRARFAAKDIHRYCQAADFVAIGKCLSGFSDFEITDVLKGVKRDLPDIIGLQQEAVAYHAFLDLPQEREILIDNDTPYILFLSEKDARIAGFTVYYTPVSGMEGIVLADADALATVRQSLRKDTGAQPLPALLVYDDVRAPGPAIDKRAVLCLQKAAEKRFTVLRQITCTPGHGPPGTNGPIPPGGNAWVEWYFEHTGSTAKLHLTAHRVGQGKRHLVFQGDCDPKSNKELAQTAEEIVRRLLDPKI
jgi:hypothetical protein